MSTIKVNKIENTSTTNGGVSIDNDGHVTIDGQQMPTAGPLSNRNLIINGAMEVDQRNDGSSISVTGDHFAVDRWTVRAQSTTTATSGRSTDAPTGFTNSIFVNVGATAVARSAADNRQFRQLIEGVYVRNLFWGTANAKPVTISFWVKSSLTGTYDFAFFSGAVDQSYITQYTINTANTWEYKTISVPGATSGTFDADTSVALYCHWDLGGGSDYQSSTLDQWISGDKRASTSGTDLFATANANFYLTGVQLEEGDKPTPFAYRTYPDELRLCRRYFEKVYVNGAAASRTPYYGEYLVYVPYKETKRPRSPILFVGSSVSNYQPGGGIGTIGARLLTTEGCLMKTGSPNTNTSYIPNYVNDADAHFTADAEL